MSGALKVNVIDSVDNNSSLSIGQNASSIYIGSGNSNDSQIITIGSGNDVINILGKTNYIETTNTQIKNKILTLNEGASGNNQSGLVGIQIRDNDNDNEGYIITSSDGSNITIKAPQESQEVYIKSHPSNFYDLTTKLYVDNQDLVLQSLISGLQSETTNLSSQITTINNNTLSNIPFSKINAYPSSNLYVLKGDGSFGKVNNSNIDNLSISGLKLVGSDGSANKYLSADGTYKVIPTGNFDPSVVKVGDLVNNMNNKTLTNLLDPVNNQDASSKNYVDNKVSSIVIPTKLSDLTVSNTTDINLNSHKLINVLDPVNSQDVSTKNYVDNKYNQIISASSYSYQPSVGAPQLLNKFNIVAIADLWNNNIVNLLDPINPQDGATKNYIDNKLLSNLTPSFLGSTGNVNSAFDMNCGRDITIQNNLIGKLTNNTRLLSVSGGLNLIDSLSNGVVNDNNISCRAITTTSNITTIAPTSDLHCSTKKYVDDKIANSGSTFTGGNVSSITSTGDINVGANLKILGNAFGNQDLPSNPTKRNLNVAGNLTLVDSYVSGSACNDNNINCRAITTTSNIITIDPTSNNHVATKNYVDTKVASSGSTLTQTITTSGYSGSLAGITCKVLWMSNITTYYLDYNIINTLTLSLGGSLNNINISNQLNVKNTDLLVYDPTYDVVVWSSGNNGSYPNVVSLFNTYYNNGKGVIISMNATSSGFSLTKNISTSSNLLSTFTGTYVQLNPTHPIIYGCTSLVSPTNAYSTFNSQNGSTIIGSFGGTTGVAAYLDDNTLGRRVDLNYGAGNFNFVTGDTTTTGLNRLTLQAILWAARKINSASTTTSNFDANNIQLASNLNCNNKRLTNCADPISGGDVMTLNYYSNSLKPSGLIAYSSNTTINGYMYVGNCYNGLRLICGLINGGDPFVIYDIMIGPNRSPLNTTLYYYCVFRPFNTNTGNSTVISNNSSYDASVLYTGYNLNIYIYNYYVYFKSTNQNQTFYFSSY